MKLNLALKTLLFLIPLSLTSCNTLSTVKNEIAEGGFSLWYPAESGIEPGQIWQLKDNKKRIIHRKPSILIPENSTAQFQSLKKTVDASASLSAEFGSTLISEVGDFSTALKAGTVKEINLDFGSSEISRLVHSDIFDLEDRFSSSYRRLLKRVHAGEKDLYLITDVLQTSGMVYTFVCDDTAELEAKVPEIQKVAKGDFKLTIKSKREAEWRVPNSTVLVIGINPLNGNDIFLAPAMRVQSSSPNFMR